MVLADLLYSMVLAPILQKANEKWIEMGAAPRVDAVVGPFAAAAGLDESELPETIACDNTFAYDVVMMGTIPREMGLTTCSTTLENWPLRFSLYL